MKSDHPVAKFRADTSNAHEDELHLRPFVKRIASAISSGDDSETWVVSIEAPWGRGKTWCMDELKRQLIDQFQGAHRVEDFNPWLLSDHRQIVQALLGKIQAWVSDGTVTALKEIGKDLRDFAGALSGAYALADRVGFELPLGEPANVPLGSGKSVDLEKLKAKVIRTLKGANTRLFVFIDDLDRVTPDEFVATIRTIKAVADFPHVTYVVAFDAQIADEQLKNAGIGRGAEYLDKVIQLRAPLPPITKQQKQVLFDQAIAGLPPYARSSTELHSYAARARKLFHSGLAASLRTPRDVKRIVNRLLLLPEQVFCDVNLADLFALATIELVDAKMFAKLVESASSFVSNEIPHETQLDGLNRLHDVDGDRLSAHREFLQKVVNENSKPATRQLLHLLFPQIWSEASRSNAPFDLLAGHIAHTRNFWVALQGMLPDDSIPIQTVRELLRSTGADFEHTLNLQLTAGYSLAKILDGLHCVLPYERPQERSCIWDTLLRQVRADSLEREANGSAFANTSTRKLISIIHDTERFARSNERGDLLPFSFRDWVAENLSEQKSLMFWPSVFLVCFEQADRPLALVDGSLRPYEPEIWDRQLLSQLMAGKADYFESGEFLDEPESGFLLEKMATILPTTCEKIVDGGVQGEYFDRLATRIVNAYSSGRDGERKCFVNFRSEHPLRVRFPSLIDRANERLKVGGLPPLVMFACTAIVTGNAEIPSHHFSDPLGT
ncbi:MAG: hypothetical protein EAZ30_12680 [Betaproteobacteria bacterium]|nr:MAG: hypothetical protein EAZ30_12680 [Betaproteobacteria bacterium]